MLADLELQFVPGELDPVKHFRGIVSSGHISGMMVYPDYFVVLGGKIHGFFLYIGDKFKRFVTPEELISLGC